MAIISLVIACIATILHAQSFAIFQVAGSTYNGISATRTGVSAQATASFDTTNKQMMARSAHIARAGISNVKIIESNFFVDSGFEVGSGATAVIKASIEYPQGVCTQILFSGSSSGNVVNGSTLLSDGVNVSIPNGATFWVRRYWTSTGGVIYTGNIQTITGDNLNVGVSGIADQTVSCDGITNSGSNILSIPLAIVSPIAVPSLCFLGDSITYGIGDSTSANGDRGAVARSIGPTFGYTNLGAPSDKAQTYVAQSHAGRGATYPYCSHKIVWYGANDLNGGRTAAQLESDLTTVYGTLGTGARVFQNSILPWDSNAPTCSTVLSWEAQRLILNDALKGGSFGPSKGAFDTSGVVETSIDSGAWKTTPQAWSGDCIHPNPFGAGQIATIGAIDVSRIILP